MKEFTIGKNDAGQRLDRWLAKTVPLLPAPLAQKYIRLKRVKRNGKGSKRDVRLEVGDVLQLYINDEFFQTPNRENAFLSVFKPQLDIVYEDEHILLLNKRPGMVVHPDDQERVNTLLTHIQAYLYQKKEWSPYWENSFAPALCNRIDRNTGGLVIAAKTAEALRIMNQKIKDRELTKLYLCVIRGEMRPRKGELKGFILKDENKAQVKVYDHPVPGGKTALTLYNTLATEGGLSLVECDLITGRTHQIRAQFAAAGHPLLGDGKYGRERDNRPFGRSYQALYSYKLRFEFTTDGGCLSHLNGMEWTVRDIDFVPQYFPKFSAQWSPQD
ncbi:RluA family pseudouridine synthase [Pseudoflavonifractor sp. An187]|uniref:RluA family pseudouridine synthase n=1 Tax=Pseudoflavonifractor sp. An187 TaxID=1965578 RepID=UPI000B376C05|nr:RluA family pseudouridine synthase [Pseudoflavonifractor sp. An187]OUP46025.1 RNA pseudouridine synthase [Pseudoflavonifractor sp. An187]